jgi:class 3 adenylate cyclase/tetratricopeptide (TPR) repeat protein
MLCPSCGTENRKEARFCHACGASLARACPACGAPTEPGYAFCEECGAPLGGVAATPQTDAARRSEVPVAERRLVSVLFADLVGFTTRAEERDAEEVRELLSRYFDASRRVIDRFGGTVEKFIGDAVMAVWGAPVAREDDAERAVRAALDLVAAVESLAAELGVAELQVRAGVATGEAAVTVGAEGEGMVAGDLVNAASRIQSLAAPGSVLVADPTRRASEGAIAYENAGLHELKGRQEPVLLWRATRVTAGIGGKLRTPGLEPPFVGRARELHLIKELFHATAEKRGAHVVSVLGEAGIGKSRLAWEFFKYVDGLADDTWWHHGRCLAYGDGVAYWALSEIVRMRAGIAEEEEAESATEKLSQALEPLFSDPEERAWAEPRLAHLLGLVERTAGDRDDLFAAWRLFFERMAETEPVVLLFEDLQWADPALLDFIEYLLEWSRDQSLFILTLARPELLERRPTWGAGKPRFHSVVLEPLAGDEPDRLLRGLVPGLSDDVLRLIQERAEGVPLYAVETVRMLIDRGVLEPDDGGYRLTGRVEALDVPETLHALIAARLDGLATGERRLLADASVLGKTFTKRALSALHGDGELEPLLASLLRKEILTVETDPRSPERGQYGFLHGLVQRIAYEMLSLKERKARHLAVAEYLESGWRSDEDEIVEVIASHYLDAYHAAPDAEDAAEIGARAKEWLVRAGERAASLAATEQAERYFAKAAELAESTLARAELLDRAGQMAWARGSGDSAEPYLARAIELFEAENETRPAARVAARLGEITWGKGRIEEAVERMERSLEVLAQGEPDENVAALAAQLGRLLFFMGRADQAAERVELALTVAERLLLPETLSEALNTKSLILGEAKRRPEEANILLLHALRVALDHHVPASALRAYYNLSNLLYYRDRYQDSLEVAREGLPYARRVGNRNWEWSLVAALVSLLYVAGEWDEALQLAAEVPAIGEFTTAVRFSAAELVLTLPPLHLARGHPDEAVSSLEPFADFRDSADVQERASYAAALAAIRRSEGKPAEALEFGSDALAGREALGITHSAVKLGLIEAVEAALALGDHATAQQLLGHIDALGPADATAYLRAQSLRLGARCLVLRGENGSVEARFEAAAGLFREVGSPFWVGVAQLEHCEWLVIQGRSDEAEPLLAEAGEIFERLGATSWLERVEQTSSARGERPAGVPAPT